MITDQEMRKRMADLGAKTKLVPHLDDIMDDDCQFSEVDADAWRALATEAFNAHESGEISDPHSIALDAMHDVQIALNGSCPGCLSCNPTE